MSYARIGNWGDDKPATPSYFMEAKAPATISIFFVPSKTELIKVVNYDKSLFRSIEVSNIVNFHKGNGSVTFDGVYLHVICSNGLSYNQTILGMMNGRLEERRTEVVDLTYGYRLVEDPKAKYLVK